MKKSTIIIFFGLFLFIPLLGQQSFIPQSLVVNVEVPIRVFAGEKFVSDLDINDFQVFENGIEQKIEAVYLVNKKTIKRSTENTKFFPETARTFFLFFEVSEYTAYMKDALDFFCAEIILPGDKLYIITPIKTYKLVDLALKNKTPMDISKELNGLLRKDIMSGNSEYRDMIQNLIQISRQLIADIRSAGSGDPSRQMAGEDLSTSQKIMKLQEHLLSYNSELARLDTIRKIDQMKLLDFARFLKGEDGQKHVFLFYQREFIPQLDSNLVNEFLSVNMEYADSFSALNMFRESGDFHKRDISLDVDLVKKAFADSSISVHFLMISNPRRFIEGIQMKESSEDIFGAFRQMALASGGFMESSARPDILMQNATSAAQNYYLLYYTPKDYVPDGRFKEIRVRIKGRNLKVIHRKGYFSY
ncbi:MAG: hypothetical protein JXB26_19525 [Candidatus Aminicenantes bacterium]|nr:hypothetical protein [Candidatus Aminicenantes bacterium]